MEQVYCYKLKDVRLPEDVAIEDYGNLYKCDYIETNEHNLDYRHKTAIGAFILDNRGSVKGKVKEKYDITLSSIEDFGPEVRCCYEVVPSSTVWRINGYEKKSTITTIIILSVMTKDESYSDNVLGVAEKLHNRRKFSFSRQEMLDK